MTVRPMTEADRWGEARTRERSRTLRKRIAWIVGGGMLLIVGIPFGLGVYHGYSDAARGVAESTAATPPMTLMVACALGLAAVVAFGGWRIWRAADEVQRRMLTNSWAAVGVVGAFLSFVAGILMRTPYGDTALAVSGWAALAAGIATYVWQRVRGTAA